MYLRSRKYKHLCKVTYPYLTVRYSFVVDVGNGIIKLYIVEVKGKGSAKFTI